MSQDLARQIIYTTHSIGTLPPDLGSAVRVVAADVGRERSKIANSYWSVARPDLDKVGYAPLLFAMGASLLSLTVPRCGVVVEGISDAILLPTLLRECSPTGEPLSYRILPGLSELGPRGWGALPAHAGSVACLVDGDAGGDDLRSNIIEAGLPEARVLSLGSVAAEATLEDLVSAEFFAQAVNAEIETWGLGDWRAEPANVPSVGRWDWMEQAAEAEGTKLDSLSKARCAQRIAEAGRDGDWPDPPPAKVRPEFADAVGALHAALVQMFEAAD